MYSGDVGPRLCGGGDGSGSLSTLNIPTLSGTAPLAGPGHSPAGLRRGTGSGARQHRPGLSRSQMVRRADTGETERERLCCLT